MIKIFCNFMDGKDFEDCLKQYPEIYNKPITIFIDHPPQNQDQLKINPYNFMVVLEPNQLFGIHDWVLKNNNTFDAIFAWGESVLSKCDNSIFFPFGISWLDTPSIDTLTNQNKTFEVSFLCGGKKRIEGHHLRHRLHERKNEITIPKQWHYTLPDYNFNEGNHTIIKQDNKPPGFEKQRLWKSMFSICIENSSNSGYHTEKVIDAFLSKTIPIYWGCTNLKELGYDPKGYIYCENEDEIIKESNNLTPEIYNSKTEAIEHNFKIAQHYANIFERFAESLNEVISLNDMKGDSVWDYRSLFSKYKKEHNILIETGTHKGDGVAHALDLGFEKIKSVEILDDLYDKCVNRFSSEIEKNKVNLFLGDSNKLLPEMIKDLNEPSLIFLDGHFHNGDPLWGELEILKNHHIKEHTIIVDDFPNYFSTREEELKTKLKEINPNYKFSFENSYNPGTSQIHYNHNLIAYL